MKGRGTQEGRGTHRDASCHKTHARARDVCHYENASPASHASRLRPGSWAFAGRGRDELTGAAGGPQERAVDGPAGEGGPIPRRFGSFQEEKPAGTARARRSASASDRNLGPCSISTERPR